MREQELIDVVDEILGPCGKMLSGSKIAPPGQNVVWNANVCVGSRKVWFGDLNVTKSEDKLKALAKLAGEPVYVLREMDARFNNEAKPLLENAVYTTE